MEGEEQGQVNSLSSLSIGVSYSLGAVVCMIRILDIVHHLGEFTCLEAEERSVIHQQSSGTTI